MNTLTEDEERGLIQGIKLAADMIDGGMQVDDALAKVATDSGYGPGTIRLLANSYNTGRQAGQRQAEGLTLSKLARFDLADPEAITTKVCGTKKEARHSDYDMPPAWPDGPVKSASDRLPPVQMPDPYPEDRPMRLSKAHLIVDSAKSAADEARVAVVAADDRFRNKLASVVDYFRSRSPGERVPFPVVDAAVSAYYGTHGSMLMDLVHRRGNLEPRFGEKRAAELTPARAINLDAAPFPMIRDCIKAATEAIEIRGTAKTAADRFTAAREEQLRPFVSAAQPRPDLVRPLMLKGAFFGGIIAKNTIGSGIGSFVAKNVGEVPESTDDLVGSAVSKLEDPTHQDEMRRIRAQAMLNGFMTDPDDPISGYDPDDVLRAYSELSQLAPRAADQPAAIAPLLRRRLAGQFEPFEAGQVTDIEHGVLKTRQPPRGSPDDNKRSGGRKS